MQSEGSYICSKRGVSLEEKACSIRNVTSAVQVTKCPLPGGLHLQYEKIIMQCD